MSGFWEIFSVINRSLFGKAIATAWSWWIGELRQCLPHRLSVLFRQPRPRLGMRIDGPLMSLIELDAYGRPEGERVTAAVDDAEALASALRHPSLAGLAQQGIRLCLGPASYLKRSLAVPRSATGSLDAILALEVGRVTPFKSEEVVSAWRIEPVVRQDGKVDVSHVVVKRRDLASWVDRLKETGLAVTSVALEEQPGRWADFDLLRHVERPASIADRRLARLNQALLVLIACCGVLLPAIVFYKQAQASQELDSEIERRQAEAMQTAELFKDIEASSRRIARWGERKSALPPLVAILEDITRRLPDDAWLANLAIENGEVSIAGQARSAAGLLGLIEASGMFDGVHFTAPVYKDPVEGTERFSLAMKLTAAPAGP